MRALVVSSRLSPSFGESSRGTYYTSWLSTSGPPLIIQLDGWQQLPTKKFAPSRVNSIMQFWVNYTTSKLIAPIVRCALTAELYLPFTSTDLRCWFLSTNPLLAPTSEWSRRGFIHRRRPARFPMFPIGNINPYDCCPMICPTVWPSESAVGRQQSTFLSGMMLGPVAVCSL